MSLSSFTGSKLEFTTDARKLHSVPLGQGQEAEAEIAMEKHQKKATGLYFNESCSKKENR
ncbi:unnamed protein product [Lepidochelys olivacea]